MELAFHEAILILKYEVANHLNTLNFWITSVVMVEWCVIKEVNSIRNKIQFFLGSANLVFNT